MRVLLQSVLIIFSKEINEMFIDLFSESCKEGGGGGGGGLSVLGKEDEPVFRWYILPDEREFLVIFYKVLQSRSATNS